MFKNYLKIAVRNLLRHKVYTFINIFGLAIGMTCCILILLYIQDEFSYDHYPEKDDQIFRLALEVQTPDRGMINSARTPPPWAPALANDYPEVESYVRFKTPLVSWMISYEAKEKRFHEKGFYFADPTVFDFFSLRLIRGDPIPALKEPRTVVLTESMAENYFGDENPIDKIIRADNTYDFRVTGIMQDVPKNAHLTFGMLASVESLNGLPIYGGTEYSTFERNGLNPDIYTYLRLKKDYPSSEFEKKFPEFLNKYLGRIISQLNIEIHPFLQPLTSIHLHSNLDAELMANSSINYIYIFSAVSLFILLVACINFMNLATARSASRAEEVGMRKVVGANRGQLIRQFLGESIFLSFIALVTAIILVKIFLPAFNVLSGKGLSLDFNNSLAILALIGIAFLVGIISGSYPAFFLSAFPPASVLRGVLKSSYLNALLRKALVVFQFAISIIFIIGTGIVYRQLHYVQNVRLGFDKEHVVVIPLGDPRARQIYRTFKNQVLQSPDVLAVSGTSNVPGSLIGIAFIRPEGVPAGQEITIEHIMVDHDFIKALGIELNAGRDFSISYSTDIMQAFILNESAIKHLGWEENPLDRRIILQGFKNGRVVGVMKDFHVKSLHQRIEPLFIHIAPNPDALHYLALKISADNAGRTLDFIEEKWRNVYPHDPFIYS
ncbi:MAG: ABC transporter permease, partial [Candidatus Aminicenantes bacterium]